MSKNIFDPTFFRFIIVGVVNTVVGTAIMFIFYNLFHFSYWVSSASNYILASILSWFLNKYFTFKKKDTTWKSVLIFAVNIAVCYVLAYTLAQRAMLWIFSDLPRNWQENLAMVGGMGLFVILNYAGQRFLVFANKEQKEQKAEQTAISAAADQ